MRIFIFLILTFSTFAQAKVNYYYPNKDMPFELKVLFEGYNSIATENDKTTEELDKFLTILLGNLTKLDREEILFLSKSEIIKTVLKNNPEDLKTDNIPQDFLNELKENIGKEDFRKLNPFARWLMSSLLVDYENLLKTKNNKVSKRRLDLIIPFLNSIRLNGLGEFDVKSRELLLESAKRLVHFSSVVLLYSSRLSVTPSAQKLAVINQQKPDGTKQGRDIEDILSPIIEKHKKLGLPVPVDDWKPSENDFNLKSQAVSPSEGPAKVIDANSLPQPVDDWNVEDLL